MTRWRPAAGIAWFTALGQTLLFLASLAIARLYTPEAIGAATALLSVLAVVGMLAALRYDLALPLIDSDRDAVAMVSLCLGLVGVTAIIVGGVAVTIGETVTDALETSDGVAELRYAVAPAVAAIGAATVFTRWAQRDRAYGRLARAQLAQDSTSAAGQIGGGVLALGAPGLVLAAVVAAAVGAFGLARRPVMALRSATRPSRERLVALARRYRALPTLSLPTALANGVALLATPLLLAALYDLRVAGLYAVAQRALTVPLRIVGNAASLTFFGDAAHARRSAAPELRAHVRETARTLALVGAAPVAVLLVAGPELFAMVFGDDYRQAGAFAQPLALLCFSQLVANPLSQVFTVVERLGLQLAITLARLLAMLGPLLAAWAAGAGPQTALVAYSAGGVASYALAMWLSDRAAAP